MKKGIETERKFIVKMPDISSLSKEAGYTVSRILQTYLESEGGVTHRVRRREYADHTEFYETKKTRISTMSAIEEEGMISEECYTSLLQRKATGTVTLEKVRHTVPVGNLIYEFDIYPQWTRTCIMEVELADEEAELRLPDFVEVVEEVTGMRAYSNAAMARVFPKEKAL